MNLKTGWLTYPRPKTGIERRIPLWPETVEAIRAANSAAAPPKGLRTQCLVFIGRRGEPYLADNGYRVAGEFVRVLTAAKIELKGGFYGLRHTFQTVAEGAGIYRPFRRSWAMRPAAATCRHDTGSALTTIGCWP